MDEMEPKRRKLDIECSSSNSIETDCSKASILSLPVELHWEIAKYLQSESIRNVVLSCKCLNESFSIILFKRHTLDLNLFDKIPDKPFQNIKCYYNFEDQKALQLIESFNKNHFGSVRDLQIKIFVFNDKIERSSYILSFLKKFEKLRSLRIGFNRALVGSCSKRCFKSLVISSFVFNVDFYMEITKTVLRNLQCLKIINADKRPEFLQLLKSVLNEHETSIKHLTLMFVETVKLNLTANLTNLESFTISNSVYLENIISFPNLKEFTILINYRKRYDNTPFLFFENLLTYSKFESTEKLRIFGDIEKNVNLFLNSSSESPGIWKLPQLKSIEIVRPFENFISFFVKIFKAPNVVEAKLEKVSKDDLKLIFELFPTLKNVTLIEHAIDRISFLKATSKVLFGQHRLGRVFSLNYELVEIALTRCKDLKSLTIDYKKYMTQKYEVFDLFSYLTRFKHTILSESFTTLNIFTTAKEELFSDNQVFENISKGHNTSIEVFDGINSKKICIFKKSFKINLFFDM
ncbi:hypothetical protein ACFFRR_010111 [Megaselia abdita]